MATAAYGGLIMLKKIEYETKDINEVALDLAEEIKLGWKIYQFGMPNAEFSMCCHPKIIIEVILSKDD